MNTTVPAGRTNKSALTDPNHPVYRIVLVLALPVLAQQLLVLSVGLSDRLLAGRLNPIPPKEQLHALGNQLLALGQHSGGATRQSFIDTCLAPAHLQSAIALQQRQVAYQAAQTTGIYLGWTISGFTVLISVGGTALVARLVGAGDRRNAVRATNQAIVLAIALGLAGTVIGLLGVDHFVAWLNLEGDARRFAVEYLRPMILLSTFQVVEAAGNACLIGAGDTRTGFWVLGGVALLNVSLAWAFFFGLGPLPELRFEGIAWGTGLSHVFGCVAVLAVLLCGRAGLRLNWRDLRPCWELIWRLLRISAPAGLDSFTIMFGHLWFLSIVNQLGDAASSAHGIALGWEAMSFLSGVAFGTAAMTMVGQNLGAGQPARAARSGWTAFAMGGGMMCLMGVVFYILAPAMFGIFCPHPEQQPVVALGVRVLRLEAFAEPALASVIIFLSALRGAGDTTIPVFFNLIGLVGIRVPLAYALALDHFDLGFLGSHAGFGMGLFGAWLAMVIDLFIRGCFFFWRFASGRWMLTRV